ncbi:Glutaminase [Nesidiocoris tenuis]|uniref:glutaminase n=1 Tax=Nesidiocoris tenuis TaxID=355587 RepID=A0ABN7AHI7_9HEMI|nr:Glutaminase [Nesidiocoris tenuis]
MWARGRLALVRPRTLNSANVRDASRKFESTLLRSWGRVLGYCPFHSSTLQFSRYSNFEEFHKKVLSGSSSTRPYAIIHDPSFVHSASDAQHTKGTEDLLFEMFTVDDPELTSVGKFLAALRQTGLRKTDPRLAGLMQNLRKFHQESKREGGSPETQKLTREQFKDAIAANLVLISRAFRHHFIIPDFSDFTKYIEDFYWKCKSNSEGKLADYIPQLARTNPEHWGVSVCTIDGQRFSIGDVNIPFTLQSTSKPLTYGIALDQLTQEVVHQYVGQEPSGRNFNELVLDHNKKPHNPMINAGAIIICSLLKTLVHPEMTLAEKFDFTMDYFKRLAGGEYLGFNNAVFLSEREAADRNYALGFYMREHKCYPEKTVLKECMDFYFQVTEFS